MKHIHWSDTERNKLAQSAAKLMIANPGLQPLRALRVALSNHPEIPPRPLPQMSTVDKWYPALLREHLNTLQQPPPPSPAPEPEPVTLTFQGLEPHQQIAFMLAAIFKEVADTQQEIKNVDAAIRRLTSEAGQVLSQPPTIAPLRVQTKPTVYLVSFHQRGDILKHILRDCRELPVDIIPITPGRDHPIIPPGSYGLFGEWGGHAEQQPYWQAFPSDRRWRLHGASQAKKIIQDIARMYA